jgi:hypothetical protein
MVTQSPPEFLQMLIAALLAEDAALHSIGSPSEAIH